MGLKKNYIYIFIYKHTQNTHRHRAKSLGAFADHLEKMIINIFVFIRLSVHMEYP